MAFESSQWEWNADKCGKGIEPVHIDRVRGLYHGQEGIRYAVRQHGATMNAEGEWFFEPTPSERTDEWLDEFRFLTWEAAAKAIERNLRHPWGRLAEYEA